MALKQTQIFIQSLFIFLLTDGCYGLTYYYGNGSHYIGDVDNHGRPSGDGLYYTKRGGLMYNGTFTAGVFDGQGTWYGDEGHRYEGGFSWGMGNGNGTWQTPRGDVITGNFRNHSLHGEAVWLFAPDSSHRLERMEGQFRRGMAHGEGEVIFRDGSRLEVTFKKGYPHGIGKLFSQDEVKLWEGLVWNGTPVGVVPDDIGDLFNDFHLNPLRLRYTVNVNDN